MSEASEFVSEVSNMADNLSKLIFQVPNGARSPVMHILTGLV
jgi:hypothetical protein